jgi:hypothetical protein
MPNGAANYAIHSSASRYWSDTDRSFLNDPPSLDPVLDAASMQFVGDSSTYSYVADTIDQIVQLTAHKTFCKSREMHGMITCQPQHGTAHALFLACQDATAKSVVAAVVGHPPPRHGGTAFQDMGPAPRDVVTCGAACTR